MERRVDSPVDNIVDLGLVNYVQHPSNPEYIVYRFVDPERAASFEKELKDQSIWFEKDIENKREKEYILFGVHSRDFKRTDKINFKVEGKHKKPLIPFKAFRYFIVILGLGLLILAMIGYCKQQEKLSLYNNDGALLKESKK
ncbi:hypothetical protein N9P79_01580 [Crocinitomicaceae bacterium]|jgi:hypothetical protein|nr:hypothetical protein [Crocinitomicaceae bacterium]MDB4075565.1 hypothetical protein [Crocinitomicaceae bacterium]MDC0098981.1 hypothetical protein [Crocinitomicaceae bacterium]